MRGFAKEAPHNTQRTHEVYTQALGVAQNIGDLRPRSFALGHLGRLYEEQYCYDEALRLTRRATFLTPQLQSPDLLYRW